MSTPFNPTNIIDSDQVLLLGKHKGRNINDVIETDQNYVHWLSRQPWASNDQALMKLICNVAETGMRWGKHKGKPLSWIIANDENYIKWLKASEYVATNCKTLKEQLDKIKLT